MQFIFDPGSDMMGTEFWVGSSGSWMRCKEERPKVGKTAAVVVKSNPSQR